MAYTTGYLALALGVYLILRSIYRLWFHPLSKIPGPRLAAISHLYEFYYDTIKGGMYIWEVERMHEKYGPIVRFNPRELHVKDSYYYDQIYAGSAKRRDKDHTWVLRFIAPGAVGSTISHDHHRRRRGYINDFFSKQSVLKMEPLIWEKVNRLAQRLDSAYYNGSVLDLHFVFGALTADIITHSLYGTSLGYLDDENFSSNILEALGALTGAVHIVRFFPILLTILRYIPLQLMQRLGIPLGPFIEFKLWLRQQASWSLKKEDVSRMREKGTAIEKPKETLFDTLTAADIPPIEKGLNRLEDELFALFAAGTETTARVLTVAAFHLSMNTAILLRLREELKLVMPTPSSAVTWPQLKQLPYLTAVVNESLRLSYGLISRIARISPAEAMTYQSYVIPPGTPVSQSSYFVHMDPSIFPDPKKFDPERWVRAAEKGKHVNKFLVSFSKGSRGCVGINLAYAELYLTIAMVARRFDIEPYQTTIDDIAPRRDKSLPCPEGKFSVKATVVGIVKK